MFLLIYYRMDVHPSRELVASGQRAGADRKSQAHVRIWSTDSLQTLYVFGMGELIGGVTSVAFSQLVSGTKWTPFHSFSLVLHLELVLFFVVKSLKCNNSILKFVFFFVQQICRMVEVIY